MSNFLAKRGDRIASSSMPLNRLMNRLSDGDPCDEDGLKDASHAVSFDGVGSREVARGNGSSPSVMRSAGGEDRLATFSRGASFVRDPTDSQQLQSTDENGTSDQPTQRIGVTALGSEYSGRVGFAASVLETKAMADSIASSKVGVKSTRSCGERRQPRLDAWSDGHYEYFTYHNSSGHFNLLRAGIDYRVTPGLLLGVMVQYDNAEDKSNALGYAVRGSGWMYGPYGAIKLGAHTYFDGRLLWGTSSNEVAPLMTYVDEFASKRFLAAGRLSGLLKWDRLSLMPSVEYVHYSDRTESFFNTAGTLISEQSVNINRIITGPEIRYSMPISGSWVVDASASVKGIWDLTPIVLKDLDGSEGQTKKSDLNLRVDVGVNLSNQEGYTIGVGVGIEGRGGDEFISRSVRGKIRIPLN